ncbi:MAG: VWA domain-containing protein [Myxococcales bacterium]|nr:VWA domain-containing protein [Myxococcales bacterium]
MNLDLSTERGCVLNTGGSRRHLVIRWTAPPLLAAERRAPVRIAFSIDRSGSMTGRKISTAKQALLGALALLDESDSFSIVSFDDKIEVVMPLGLATSEAKDAARVAVETITPRGNTNLFRGFLTACETIAAPAAAAEPGPAAGAERGPASGTGTARCMLLTDGQANQEEIHPERLAGHAGALRQRGIGLSTFGIGDDFDEELLRAMADAGGGNFFYVESAAHIPEVMRRELSEVLLISQRSVGATLTLPTGVTACVIGEHRVDAGPTPVIRLGDLVADEVIEVVVSLRFPAGAAGLAAPVTVTMSDEGGHTASATVSWRFVEEAANTTQPRNVVTDRLVAQRHADRARLASLRFNRGGRYAEAAAALSGVAGRIRGYAGTDAVLLALLVELQADAISYANQMDETTRKSRHMTTSSRIRSKEETGSARVIRVAPPEKD